MSISTPIGLSIIFILGIAVYKMFMHATHWDEKPGEEGPWKLGLRPQKKPIIQWINNKSETKCKPASFYYTDYFDCQNEKHFFVDPDSFDRDKEFDEWVNDILYARQHKTYFPHENPSISLSDGRYYINGPEGHGERTIEEAARHSCRHGLDFFNKKPADESDIAMQAVYDRQYEMDCHTQAWEWFREWLDAPEEDRARVSTLLLRNPRLAMYNICDSTTAKHLNKKNWPLEIYHELIREYREKNSKLEV